MTETSMPVKAPPTYLVLAVISFFIGAVPLAVVSVYHGSRVRPAWDTGNVLGQEEACRHSRLARNWMIAAFACGVVLWTAAIIAIATNH